MTRILVKMTRINPSKNKIRIQSQVSLFLIYTLFPRNEGVGASMCGEAAWCCCGRWRKRGEEGAHSHDPYPDLDPFFLSFWVSIFFVYTLFPEMRAWAPLCAARRWWGCCWRWRKNDEEGAHSHDQYPDPDPFFLSFWVYIFFVCTFLPRNEGVGASMCGEAAAVGLLLRPLKEARRSRGRSAWSISGSGSSPPSSLSQLSNILGLPVMKKKTFPEQKFQFFFFICPPPPHPNTILEQYYEILNPALIYPDNM